MERLPGVVLPRARPLGMAGVLIEQQLRLHALDPEPLRRALEREGVKAATFDGYLDQFERRMSDASLAGLAPAMAWLGRAGRGPRSRLSSATATFTPRTSSFRALP